MVSPSLREQLKEALRLIERSQAENQALKAEYRTLRAENESLRAEIGRLLGDNESLRDRVGRLEAEMKADSSTTGKPPSSDPIGPRKKRAERRGEARAAKRRPGKQPGAPGANLQRRCPEAVVPHRPPCCEACGADLAAAEVVGHQVRQVVDLPPVVPVVTDHVAYRLRCACGAETMAGFPPEAKSAVCYGPEVRALPPTCSAASTCP